MFAKMQHFTLRVYSHPLKYFEFQQLLLASDNLGGYGGQSGLTDISVQTSGDYMTSLGVFPQHPLNL